MTIGSVLFYQPKMVKEYTPSLTPPYRLWSWTKFRQGLVSLLLPVT
jgi:hypothetical protein